HRESGENTADRSFDWLCRKETGVYFPPPSRGRTQIPSRFSVLNKMNRPSADQLEANLSSLDVYKSGCAPSPLEFAWYRSKCPPRDELKTSFFPSGDQMGDWSGAGSNVSLWVTS